jgi:hypothetical protein
MKQITVEILDHQLQEVAKAYLSFYNAITEYEIHPSDFIQDSILQRFEYCIE